MPHCYKGLCIGGGGDGQRRTSTYPTIEVHVRDDQMPSRYDASLPIMASDVSVHTETYQYQEHYGLGFWIPVTGPAISVIQALYDGYKRKPWAKPPKAEKKSVLKVEFKTKTKQPEKECDLPF